MYVTILPGCPSGIDEQRGFMSRLETGCDFLAQRVPGILSTILAILFLGSVAPLAQSQTFSIVYNFTGKGSTGASPYAGADSRPVGESLWHDVYRGKVRLGKRIPACARRHGLDIHVVV